jgi:hypothetical protein
MSHASNKNKQLNRKEKKRIGDLLGLHLGTFGKWIHKRFKIVAYSSDIELEQVFLEQIDSDGTLVAACIMTVKSSNERLLSL